MDITHAGRLGNTALMNGRLAQPYAVTAGERLRLRLVNTANARIFDLRFTDHAPGWWRWTAIRSMRRKGSGPMAA